MNKWLALAGVLLFGYYSPLSAQVAIDGELKKWHKITLTFEGPFASEVSDTNPFTDFRLQVAFSQGNKTYVVPGYFAADGNAAETGATSGNRWRVHFSPDQTGEWSWTASFRTGDGVALSEEANAGQAGSLDGLTGTFSVAATDKTGRDLRGKGRLQYVGERYLRFAENEEYFLKAGADAPENFLAYEDFDNTPDVGGRRKSWEPHVQDWNPGDPTWKSGLGKGIIGAVNYLAEEGQNVFSFLTMNIQGDDRNVFPYISDQQDDRLRMDCSKLDQWEIVFEHADKMGMYLHFKTQETENDQLLDGGDLGPERKLYYRELIARFGHHLALNWNIGEENTNTPQQRKAFAQYFYDHDPYRHNIVIHTYPGQDDQVYTDLLGNASQYTGASLQVGWQGVHGRTLEWIEKSRDAGKNWVVANDEQGSANIGVPEDGYTGSPSQDDIRKEVLWGHLMAGGAGVEYYFGYQRPHSDLTCQDFRSRSNMWVYNKVALDFFRSYLPFWEMENRDGLVGNTPGDEFCLAKPGSLYAIYLSEGGNAELDLENYNQNYQLQWFNPRTGGDLIPGPIITGPGLQELGNPPSEINQDWVALLTPTDGSPEPEPEPEKLELPNPGNQQNQEGDQVSLDLNPTGGKAPYTFQASGLPPNLTLNPNTGEISGTILAESEGAGSAGAFEETDGLVMMEIESIPFQQGGWAEKTEGGVTFYEGQQNSLSNPQTDILDFPIRISTPGVYQFLWRSNILDQNAPTEHNDSWLRFPNNSAVVFFGYKGSPNNEQTLIDALNNANNIVYPKGSGLEGPGTTPEGQSRDGFFKIYRSGKGEWKWQSRTSDNDAHHIFVWFKEPGEYLMQVSNRSQGHKIDRMSLFKINTYGFNLAANQLDQQPESSRTEGPGENIPGAAADSPYEVTLIVTDSGDPAQKDTVTFLWEIREADEPCPAPGTACDDGDPTTVNDTEDGNCNCQGEPADPEPETLDLTSPGDQQNQEGDQVNLAIAVTGGESPLAFQATGLPPGLVIDPSTGAITGTILTADEETDAPGAAADSPYEVALIVTDSGDPAQTDTVTFLWEIREADEPCPAPGTACDDGDPNTVNDTEDGNCNCQGEPADPEPPQPKEQFSTWIEAECGSMGANWGVELDPEASNSSYVTPLVTLSSLLEAPTSKADILRYTLEVPYAGSYRIYARTITTNDQDDSFWIRANNGTWVKWNRINYDNYQNAFQWDRAEGTLESDENISTNAFILTEGVNQIEISWREPGIRFDKLYLSLQDSLPTEKGGQAPACVVTDSPSITNNEDLKIFPNPATQFVQFEVSGTHPLEHIQLFDLNGRLLRNIRGIGSFNYQMPRQGLSPGTYIVKLVFEEGVLVRRFQFR